MALAQSSLARSRRSMLLVLSILAVVFTYAGPVTVTARSQKTLDNLMAAYNGESNAHAKYLEFAKKADAEGFAGAAALFRAAANAEQTHAGNHAQVIRKLGATPKADVKLPPIATTAENVKAAFEGETYEKDKMYPAFIAEAQAAGDKDALRTFRLAISAETEHAKLYSQALSALDSWKAARSFYVCPVCGKTVTAIDFEKCPVCFTEKSKFNRVS